jgi:hypothetical protein
MRVRDDAWRQDVERLEAERKAAGSRIAAAHRRILARGEQPTAAESAEINMLKAEYADAKQRVWDAFYAD